jgi:O-antigen/teichoic acid export membrane protein
MLGDVIFGKYSFALAFVAIFAVFSDLGYNTILIREVSRDKSQASKYLNNVISMRILLSIAIFALIVVSINIMGYPADTKNAVYLFGIYTLLTSISAVFKVTFRAFEKMEYEAAITILANIIRITLGLSVLFLGYSLIELALIFVISGILEVLFSILICRKKFIKPQIEFDFDFLKNTIKIALPLSITGISLLIYTKTDTIMLSMMKGDAVVGWYNAAYNLILGFKPIPQLFMNALFPLMSSYYESSKDSLNIISEISFKFLFVIGFPLALGTTILADQIIHIFYGPQFTNSVVALQILSWDIFLFMMWTNGSFILIAANKQKMWAIAAVSTALINIAANLILIPPLSYVGAAIATIIAESLCVILVFYFIIIHTKFSVKYKNIMSILVSSFLMAIFIYIFNDLNMIILVILAMILYIFLLYLTKTFSDDDIHLIKQMKR